VSAAFEYPYWAEIAFRELLFNVNEIPGPRDNLRILEYFKATGLEPADGDQTPWCAAGENWVLMTAGLKGTGAANARSFQFWGTPTELRRGAIVVLWRVSRDDWRGHVGFLTGWTGATIDLLAGNQGNTWSIARFPRERMLSCRWPTIDQRYW
jgi:uncharacterized protein (TIGR02594 family)